MIVRASFGGSWKGVDLPWNDVRPISDLAPGSHVVLLSSSPTDGLMGRRFGLELRDTLLVLAPTGTSFAFLFRKELEGTVAENVWKHGTGALWIDGCRIYTDWNEADRPESWKKSGYTAKPGAEKIAAPPGQGISLHPQGRWPSNLVLIHGSECRQGKAKPVVWVCAPGCPVAELERQGGDRRSSGNTSTSPVSPGKEGFFNGKSKIQAMPGINTYNDSGGASRFYPQFENDVALLTWFRTLLSTPSDRRLELPEE